MNALKSFFIRFYQKTLYVFSFFLPIREPLLIKGTDSFNSLVKILRNYNKKKVLLVTDSDLHKIGIDEFVYTIFKEQNFDYSLYFNVTANPSIIECEEGAKQYVDEKCDCIVAIGGGSAMDAAKVIGAKVANYKKPIQKMKGLFKVKRKIPLMIAIPTTAGTGSETTIVAVVTNRQTKEKFAIESCKLTPNIAILNPSLLVNLPAKVTSTTGMDALTHAVEAYIGSANTKQTKHYAILATQLVFKYLQYSYDNPTDLQARQKMQVASYYAGISFTRAYVGYVHAVAHQLGGFYNVPHGLANAVVLPIVLKRYGKKAYKKLAELYNVIDINNTLSIKEKAERFIEMIEKLNESLGISNTFGHLIKKEDIPLMVDRAYKEAIPLYPVPQLWNKKQFEDIFEFLSK